MGEGGKMIVTCCT